MAVDILLPTALAAPLLFMLLRKVQQLAIAHRELSVIASTDSLTAVLNRGAFTMLVDAYLSAASKETSIRSGALLVIDADYFKKINDKLGHQLGDQALKIIAKTIKGVLRNADIVGRIRGVEPWRKLGVPFVSRFREECRDRGGGAAGPLPQSIRRAFAQAMARALTDINVGA